MLRPGRQDRPRPARRRPPHRALVLRNADRTARSLAPGHARSLRPGGPPPEHRGARPDLLSPGRLPLLEQDRVRPAGAPPHGRALGPLPRPADHAGEHRVHLLERDPVPPGRDRLDGCGRSTAASGHEAPAPRGRVPHPSFETGAEPGPSRSPPLRRAQIEAGCDHAKLGATGPAGVDTDTTITVPGP